MTFILITCSAENNNNQTKKITVKLYIDNSASMGGYFRGPTEFKSLLTSIAAKISMPIEPMDKNLSNNVEFSFFSDHNKHLTNYTSEDFIQNILKKTECVGKSSLLNELFKICIDSTNDRTLSIIASDLCFSYSTNEIKFDRELNRNNISSIKSLIFSSFSKARGRKNETKILSFKSSFNGIYYDCANKKHELNQKRPIYLIIVGEHTILSEFVDNLKKNESTIFEEMNSIFKTITHYKVPSHFRYKNKWIPFRELNQNKNSSVNFKMPNNFLVGVNLSSVPDSYNLEYLNKNLKFTCNGLHVENCKLDLAKSFSLSEANYNLGSMDSCTHYISFQLKDIYNYIGSVQFRIDNKIPPWVQNQSTSDDRNISSNTYKTFGLIEILSGIHEAYSLDSRILDININISR